MSFASAGAGGGIEEERMAGIKKPVGVVMRGFENSNGRA